MVRHGQLFPSKDTTYQQGTRPLWFWDGTKDNKNNSNGKAYHGGGVPPMVITEPQMDTPWDYSKEENQPTLSINPDRNSTEPCVGPHLGTIKCRAIWVIHNQERIQVPFPWYTVHRYLQERMRERERTTKLLPQHFTFVPNFSTQYFHQPLVYHCTSAFPAYCKIIEEHFSIATCMELSCVILGLSKTIFMLLWWGRMC